MVNNPLVTINVVVRNGEKYIRHCLRAVAAQSYEHLQVNIWDNNSTDATRDIVATEFPQFNLIAHPGNLGMWPGQEAALAHTDGKYVVALSVDVMIDPNFISNAVRACELNPAIGALQAKIYQYEYDQLADGSYKTNTIIDTCGFALTRERKVVNIGHGYPDSPRFAERRIIFGVEGAAPFFRRSALEQCRIDGHIWDHDYFWYGDDLDVAWRMTLFGHQQIYLPIVIAWHNRSTTKSAEHTGLLTQTVNRRKLRKQIPIQKRRLDWSNTRFTIIKNDHLKNLLRDLPAIIIREINVQGYAGLFERGILLEWGRFLRLLPRMLLRRHTVMARARLTADEIRPLMIVNEHEAGTLSHFELWWRILRAIVTLIVILLCVIAADLILKAIL